MSTSQFSSVRERVRQIVEDQLAAAIGAESLGDGADLFDLGLDSMTSVALVLALESEFGVSFDLDDIRSDNFRTIANITELVVALHDGTVS